MVDNIYNNIYSCFGGESTSKLKFNEGSIVSMYAKINVVGKNRFTSKNGKEVHMIYGAILQSASEYDTIEEGYKVVNAFVSADVYKDINRKDVIDGNLNYKDGMVSFWPYGMKSKNVQETS